MYYRAGCEQEVVGGLAEDGPGVGHDGGQDGGAGAAHPGGSSAQSAESGFTARHRQEERTSRGAASSRYEFTHYFST